MTAVISSRNGMKLGCSTALSRIALSFGTTGLIHASMFRQTELLITSLLVMDDSGFYDTRLSSRSPSCRSRLCCWLGPLSECLFIMYVAHRMIDTIDSFREWWVVVAVILTLFMA